MNILIFQPRISYYVGGGEIVPFEHARYLSNLGHKITILTTRGPFIAPSEYFLNYQKTNPGVHFEYLEIPDTLKWIYEKLPGNDWQRWDEESLFVGRMAYEYILNSSEYDIVVTHNLLDCIAVPLNRKNILHLHGYPSSLDSTRRACLKIPSKIIAVSEYIKQKWEVMANIDTIEVATNGIASDYFKPLVNTTKKYDAVFIGRLITIKGVNYLLEAISLVKKDFPQIKVAIVGKGPEHENLFNLAAALDLSKNIDFIGHLPSEELVSFYNMCKIGVFPSFDREGILTTMLEASACGLPVITTNACSMPEFLIDGKNGILVRPQNSIDIAEALSKLLLNESLRIELGNRGREIIEDHWDWAQKIKSVEQIYESI